MLVMMGDANDPFEKPDHDEEESEEIGMGDPQLAGLGLQHFTDFSSSDSDESIGVFVGHPYSPEPEEEENYDPEHLESEDLNTGITIHVGGSDDGVNSSASSSLSLSSSSAETTQGDSEADADESDTTESAPESDSSLSCSSGSTDSSRGMDPLHPLHTLYNAINTIRRSDTTSVAEPQLSLLSSNIQQIKHHIFMSAHPDCTSEVVLEEILNNFEDLEIELMERNKAKAKLAVEEGPTRVIQNVWASNLYEAFAEIRSLRKTYPYVAMDTEFPGVIFRSNSNGLSSQYQYEYEDMRTNVDSLKLVQLGVALMNEDGEVPEGNSTWQFNFKFSLAKDSFSVESIKMLIISGLDFLQHEKEGIEPAEFAYFFITSGLVLGSYEPIHNTWITFHSGYDFAYLIRILSGERMPPDAKSFLKAVKRFFPYVYDLKYLMSICNDLHGGLQDVAARLGVTRTGIQHQAGSDALLTGRTFVRLRQVFFGDKLEEKYNGCLFGFHKAQTTQEQPA